MRLRSIIFLSFGVHNMLCSGADKEMACALVMVGKSPKNSSREIPFSRCINNDSTGTLVPVKTGGPPRMSLSICNTSFTFPIIPQIERIHDFSITILLAFVLAAKVYLNKW
jgi:hypothetical protein